MGGNGYKPKQSGVGRASFKDPSPPVLSASAHVMTEMPSFVGISSSGFEFIRTTIFTDGQSTLNNIFSF